LLAHRHSDHASGLSFRLDHPDAYGHQVLRLGAFRHRQEPRRSRGAAIDIHVFLHLHPQSDGGRFDECCHHAHDHRGDHGALSLFRAQGEKPMSAADANLAAPSREPTRHSLTTRIVIYGLLILFAAIYLVPLIVMVMTSLKPLDEVTGGNMFAMPHTLTF